MRMHCQIMLTMKLQNTSSGVLIQFSTVLWVSRLQTPRELPDFAYVLPTSCAHLFQNDAVSARSSSESLDSVPTWPDRALALGDPVVAFITCHMLVSRYPHISFIHYLFFTNQSNSLFSYTYLHIYVETTSTTTALEMLNLCKLGILNFFVSRTDVWALTTSCQPTQV